MAKTPEKKQEPDFESCLSELETIVERMEQGEYTLDQSLADFERGVELTRLCQQRLKEAEQRVEQLAEKQGQLAVEPFAGDKPADD